MELSRLRSGKCGICQQILAAALLAVCPKCSSSYHAECWDYNGRRCAVFGCVKDPFPRRALPSPQRHIDVFNPVVLAGFALAIAALVLFVWQRFQQL
ncbi:MAG: hypothetical protein JO332_19945 [Planctomycetaceae bacterium]|nr:hypothetical protein [Planctomycetaceae bacterium]